MFTLNISYLENFVKYFLYKFRIYLTPMMSATMSATVMTAAMTAFRRIMMAAAVMRRRGVVMMWRVMIMMIMVRSRCRWCIIYAGISISGCVGCGIAVIDVIIIVAVVVNITTA